MGELHQGVSRKGDEVAGTVLSLYRRLGLNLDTLEEHRINLEVW